MAKKPKHPEHENLERWLVSYADFITLLFATFTALFAMSQVDMAKFRELGYSLNEAFKGGAFGVFDADAGGGSVFPNPGGGSRKLSLQPFNYTPQDMEKFIQAAKAFNIMAKEKGLLQGTYATVETRGLVITILTDRDKILFRRGKAELEPEAHPILDNIGRLLKDEFSHYTVDVEGHSDSIPIENSNYPSNWELSSARSSSVVRYWLRNYDFEPHYFRVVGYADTKPASFDSRPESLAKNRRIEVVVKSTTLIGPPEMQHKKNMPLEPYLYVDKSPIPNEDYIPPVEK